MDAPGFDQLGLSPLLTAAVTEQGFTSPTPIQTAMIPLMLEGRDVIGQAQTGTGKTAAFGLPLLHNISPGVGQAQALVLAPTRELAIQVAEALQGYGRKMGARVMAVYGGAPYGLQISRLRKGVDVVVGTPGRVLDLIGQKALRLDMVETVVIDEADEMLSMGFIADIQAILEATPSQRQTALFSATLPPAIRQMSQSYMVEPHSVSVSPRQLTVEAVEQRYYLLDERDKLAALCRLLEVEPVASALIFCRTKAGTGQLADELSARGFAAEAINGDLSQEARIRVLGRFRNNQLKLLVATDVAARGLDIDDISHVINFDPPQDPEVYVHRIGRTGRAGRDGVAISLLSPRDRWLLARIEAYAKARLSHHALPSPEEIMAHREGQLLERMTALLDDGGFAREKGLAAKLEAQGHDMADIAAAALNLARGQENARPIEPVAEYSLTRPPRGRQPYPARDQRRGDTRRFDDRRQDDRRRGGETAAQPESGMVRLCLSMGRADGINAGHVLGSLSHHAEIPGRCIGKIRIQDTRTLVDVSEQVVGRVLAKAAGYRIGRTPINVELA